MFNVGEGEMLTRQDRLILESAEALLRPKRPDWFDMFQLSEVTGIERQIILDRFPFPELLAIGIMVMIWEEKLSIGRESPGYCLNRPNGFRLKASDWEPDPELLNHFFDHPVVRMYRRGEPTLCSWFRKPGKVS
jgi:hypothetical protein